MRKQTDCTPIKRRAQSLSDVVDLYITNHRYKADREMDLFRIQRHLEDVIVKAGTARTAKNKCHDHQRRVGNIALNRFAKQLLRFKNAIGTAKGFEELFAIIDKVGQKLPRIGELTIYDTAHRIGSYLELEPTKVYLHTGTREGARNLGTKANRPYLEVSDLPKEFGRLKPSEIEDCLCIHKSKLRHSFSSSK
jgi:hypothetical protein